MIDSEPTINVDETSYEPVALFTKQNLVNSQYLVGEIECEEGVSPTGGKFYIIPIKTAEYAKFMKPISLNYDSQVQTQMAGLRWWIGGLSSIDVVSKTYNYDRIVAPADLSNLSTCAFSLDGVRLIRKSESELEFEGASGYSKVTAIESNGNVTGFQVRYPNGQTALYSSMRSNGMWYQFPIKELSDRFGNKIFYNYVESGNQFFISSILYGGLDAGSCFGRIEFDYGQSDAENVKYDCGIKITQNLVLKKIVSEIKTSNEWKELCTYNLSHDGDNQLTGVRCGVGNKGLPPLHFDYGQAQSGTINLTSERTLFSNVSGALPQHTQLIRGKFLKGEFEDGMIVVTKEYNPYQLQSDHTYGSSMPADQDIYVYTGISINSKPFSIKAGSGFQSVCAADVDGDGVDEIVVTNCSRKNKNTIFYITIYKANYDGTYTKNSYDYTIEQVYEEDSNTISPVQTIPYWGDFDGDGKSELLRFNGTTMKKYLFQWNQLAEVASVALHVDMKYKDYIFWGDVNGDGKQDISYDGLNRLTDDNGAAVEYDKLGNITNRDNLVSVSYNNSSGIYQASKVVCKGKDVLPNTQIITYTSFCRPDSIFSSAAIRTSSKVSTQGLSDIDIPAIDLKKLDSCVKFVYNHNGDRVLAYGSNGGEEFKNYYLGNIYECDAKSGNERFYIAGTLTTAPLVYAKVNNEGSSDISSDKVTMR